METKGVTEDFSERGTLPWTLDTIRSTMDMIESIFEDCDAELANAGMSSLGYEKQDIDTLLEHLIILRDYAGNAYTQVWKELDNPLYEGFMSGATQALSEIVLSDITTDNTFGMEEYVEVRQAYGTKYRTSVKKELTMADFLGLEDVEPGTGLPALANVETLGLFTNLFRTDYELMGSAFESVDELLEVYLYAGEYSHEEHHPIKNFVSGILDVTIVKPFIESIYGKDLITGEKLTDFERGMQLVNALVGAVTLGQGALALDFTKMAGKDIAVELLKKWGVDAISDMASFTAGYVCDELGLPPEVSFLASMLTGNKVSAGVEGYIFKDASGNIVKQLNVDEMKTWLKEMDVDLDDMMWRGGYKEGTSILSGQWKNVNESMSDFSRVYQKQITGQEGMAWVQNGVKFDGMKEGILLDAKGRYAQFVDPNTGDFFEWFTGKQDFLDEAARQIKASEGAKIQWYFAEEEACIAVQDLFLKKGITEIELIFEAPK